MAYDVKERKLMPFQELSKRKRKDVKLEDIQVRVHLFAFDLLYLNGEVSWGSRSLQSRLPLCLPIPSRNYKNLFRSADDY